jgi:Prophage CP4-57 regulatory protein (AlpA)
VPLTYATIWQMVRDGEFPRSRSIGDRAFWVEQEIDAWIAALPNRRLKGDGGETEHGGLARTRLRDRRAGRAQAIDEAEKRSVS